MGSAQVKPSKVFDRDSPDIKVSMGTSEEREAVNDDTEDAHNTSKEVGNADGVSDTSQSDSDTSETNMTLTPEEREIYKEKYSSNFRKSITKVLTQSSFTNDGDGRLLYTDDVNEVMMLMIDLYWQLNKDKNAPLSEIIEWRKKISNIAIETKLMDFACELVKTTYPERWLTKTHEVSHVLINALSGLQNCTDASAEFAVAVAAYPGFCEKLKQMLEEQVERHVNKNSTPSMNKLTETVLSVVHNLTMVESNIGRFRKVDFLPILTAYLATPDAFRRLEVFAALAGIINEKESEIIKANMDLVKILLNALSDGMETCQHRCRVTLWSSKECTIIVRFLARNDANKKLLVELGALKLLVKMGQIGDQEEQYEAVSALWTLSFDKDNRTRIVSEAELGVVDLLLELKSSEEKSIRKACEGALWTLRDDLKTSSVEKYRGIESSESSAKVALPGNDAGHVMISYQWADQQMLKRIRDQLKAAGFKVWIDIDQMGGSTLEAMAKAVEEATVVLTCMSQKYKISPNCRAEAEYAFQKRKTIVPLMMERDFEPDGWLGMICGTKLHFKFILNYPKYKFEDVMPKLLTEIANIYDKEGKQGDTVVIPKQVPTTTMPSSAVDLVDARPPAAAGSSVTPDGQGLLTPLKSVRGWNQGDIQKWVEENDLKSCGVDEMSGEEVALLCMMYHRAPESFFRCIQSKSKLNRLPKTSRIVWAVDKLVDKQ